MSWLSEFFSDEPEHAEKDTRYDPLIAQLQANAAQDAALKQEQFQWAKQVYGENKGVTDDIVQRALATQGTLGGWAEGDKNFYNSTFRPLKQQVVSDAQTLDSEDNMARNRGRAVAEVSDKFEAGRGNAIRYLEGFGINPGSLRYAGLDASYRAAQAATQAGAANQADMATEAAGRDARLKASTLGETDANRALQAEQLGLTAGATAGNTMLQQTALGAQTMGTGLQWGEQANKATTGAGNLLTDQNKIAIEQQKLDQENTSGFGQALGLAAGIGAKYLLPKAAAGGAIDPHMVPPQASPSGGRAIDDVPAQLNVGEFVVPEDVTRWYGEKFFQNLIAKAKEAKAGAPAKPKMKQAIPAQPTYRSDARALPVG